MKRLLKFVLLIIVFSFAIVNIRAEDTDNDENTAKVRAGTFVKVMTRDEFSTLTADIGDEVTFVNTQDMFVYETNAIPENTIFYGEIEDLREPVEGKDGAIKIHIYKMITPDKKVYRLSGYIYNENDNYIGGRNTEPVYYHRVPHYIKGLKPMLQAAPLNIYEMGKHTIVKSGAELFVILEKDIILK